MKINLSSYDDNKGWLPCYPGGEDTPAPEEKILAIFFIHDDDLPFSSLVMEIVSYFIRDQGGSYWSDNYCCSVHPLCWHPLPELPAFIAGLEDKDSLDYITFDDTD